MKNVQNCFRSLGWAKRPRGIHYHLLIAAGGAIIYGLPYFRYDYYDAYLEVYHLTNTQMASSEASSASLV